MRAFLLSFIFGIFGADWFYLAQGNSMYIIAGFGKLCTLGACCIWGIADWIRILNDGFKDGQGVELYEDM